MMRPTSESVDSAITHILQNAAAIRIFSHIRPDGDAIGALLGLGWALKEAGKKVQFVLQDGVPANFRPLAAGEVVLHKPETFGEGIIACNIVVDCSDALRVGAALEGIVPDLVVDHHVTNGNFGHLNLVEPDSVATCAVLAEHLPRWGFTISPCVASALLSGIITDTIGFRTSNMNPDALRLAATLMESGADLPHIYTQALASRTFEAACYWGTGLSKLQREGKLVWSSLRLEDRKTSGYMGNDDADLVNVLSSISDCDVALIFVEQRNGHVKVSWRSRPGIDVSQIALQFGGGGHKAAAGADIPGTYDEVVTRVLKATHDIIDSNQDQLTSLPMDLLQPE